MVKLIQKVVMGAAMASAKRAGRPSKSVTLADGRHGRVHPLRPCQGCGLGEQAMGGPYFKVRPSARILTSCRLVFPDSYGTSLIPIEPGSTHKSASWFVSDWNA